MVHTTLSTLLLGAGAGLVAAHPQAFGFGKAPFPFPFGHGDHHHHHSSFPGFPSSIATGSAASGTAPVASGTAAPFSAKPFGSSNATSGFPTGAASGTAPVLGTSVASVPAVTITAPLSGTTVLTVTSPSAPASVTTAPTSSTTLLTVTSSAAPASTQASDTNITASAGCTFTDAASAVSGKGSCSTIVLQGIDVPAGTTLDMTGLNDGTTLSFAGTTTFGFQEWDGPLISVSGNSITVEGASGHVIDGNGAAWWDGEGSNGGKTKPAFFEVNAMTDSTITGLNIKNTPVQCFSIGNAQNLKIVDVTIDDSAGDAGGLATNTDAFDVGDSTGVYISGANVKNQDDCLAVNSGSDISFTGGTCSGGHGLSIGSVGGRSDNTVENVYIADSTVTNSMNGVRIKTISGATGSVKNVTYSSITLSDISDFGIVIEQDYENGDPTGTPTSGVPVTDLTMKDVTGSVMSSAQAVYILCASCSDWTMSGVSVTGGQQSKSCEGVPSGASCSS